MASVWVDDAAAVHSVVDYLVALGHRRIARVAGLPGLEHTRLRTEAFLNAARDHGLTQIEVVATDYTREEGTRATRSLLTTQPSDGDHLRQRRDGRCRRRRRRRDRPGRA